MSSKNQLIKKISDYLQDRQKTNNFGTCKKCKQFFMHFNFVKIHVIIYFIGTKNVYWSTTKVASHIRSGHCKGASEEEIQKFKVGKSFFFNNSKETLKCSLFVGNIMASCKI